MGRGVIILGTDYADTGRDDATLVLAAIPLDPARDQIDQLDRPFVLAEVTTGPDRGVDSRFSLAMALHL